VKLYKAANNALNKESPDILDELSADLQASIQNKDAASQPTGN
jgi:hypothetical protein